MEKYLATNATYSSLIAFVKNDVDWPALGLAILLSIFSFFVVRIIVEKIIFKLIRKTNTEWDDILQANRFFRKSYLLAPAIVGHLLVEPALPNHFETLHRFILAYLIVVILGIVNSFLNSAVHIYRTYDFSREKPITSYVQIVKIMLFTFGGTLIISTVLNKSPWKLFTGIGAMTAVLMLVFKDTIMGLVASFQLSFNNMVRAGDWIEMPKYGADGDVVEVTLHTVKVQNWDKTVSMIPTHALVNDSFKNWRGMSESGGRRIKRFINIDMQSICFCTDEMINRFEKIHFLQDYIQERRQEVNEFNQGQQVDESELINGRRMTNIGTFRAYVTAYLRNHPKIHKDMTFLVRHLQPGENGLPIEIYVFSTDQILANYEAIQADIFDHILAAVTVFDLKLFQAPSGSDFRQLIEEGFSETPESNS